MTHNDRCSHAKTEHRKCKCSCGGDLHGLAKESREYNYYGKDMYYICEDKFTIPDRDDTRIYMEEVDAYAWIPANSGERSHRLSLRRVVATNEYEVYRRYNQPYQQSNQHMFLVTNIDTELEEVIYKSKNLQQTCNFVNGQIHKYHCHKGDWAECKHKYPEIDHDCSKNDHYK